MTSTAPTPTSTQSPTAAAESSAPSCTTAIPGQYGNVPIDACNSNWNFDPQFVPAVAVSVMFGLLTLGHIVEAVVYKKRYAWVVCMGGIWETVAFVLGALGAHDQQNATFAIGHQLLFLLAPLWINAFVYMTLSRMVHFYLPDQKVWFIKSHIMSKIFVWADVATFLVQAAGGSMASPGSDANTVKIGLNVYTAGVGLQEGFIVIFVGLMVIFHRRANEVDRQGSYRLPGDEQDEVFVPKRGWKATTYSLYVVLALITMRIAYRIAEFASGIDPAKNPLPYNENYAYALDAAPMMAALILLLIWNPGRILQGPNSDFTEFRRNKKDAKKAKKQAKKDAKQARKEEKAAALSNKYFVTEQQTGYNSSYSYDRESA
ncbi:hypothetical protein GQ53DRAFT_795708 [Thozetella sp. PMI_491]|nr:hypothetical protein GQ53DRAFT_795708 [Thozetella sp. PMI_491]